MPGTEDGEGWGDYKYHVREQLSVAGLATMLAIPLVIAGAATALRAVV
ncbi:hypothetical protein [Gordonia sp. CPCC 205333]